MYGTSMGKLAVHIGGEEVWSKQGKQEDAWEIATVDLSSKAGQTLSVEFVGICGSGFTGDAAIDDVTFFQTTIAPSAVPTAAPTQEPTQDVVALFNESDVDHDGALQLDEFKLLVEKLGVAAKLLQPSSASKGAGTRRLRGRGEDKFSASDVEESYSPLHVFVFLINGALSSFFMVRKIACWCRR
jgi:hypothetical protein